MLKRQNIKDNLVNSSGKVSCLLLLLLTFLMISPTTTSASALEGDEDADVNYGDQIMTLADTSDITISFAPATGTASLSPVTSAGQSAQVNVVATVGVKNSGGYSVYLKGSSQNLVGEKNNANVIPGVSGSVTYANLPVNTWGYYAGTGTAVPENATYKAVTTSGNGEKIAENTSSSITSDTKTIALSFAAKINDAKPADTYKNTITMSVVSAPLQTLLSLTNMQDMNSDVCLNSTVGDEKQLKDTRDGKYYWVSKLADGQCWMTQNLDLDLSTSRALSPSDSDVASSWTPGFDTATTASLDTVHTTGGGQAEARSWSLGDYRITNPTKVSYCNSGAGDIATNCTGSQFTSYTTPTTANDDVSAHYIIGNHYSWAAATAGTMPSPMSGQNAESSICPKGWKLPASVSTSTASFLGLLSAYSIPAGYSTENLVKITSAPFYFVYAGKVSSRESWLFQSAGGYASYSTSTDQAGVSYSIEAFDNGDGNIKLQYGYDWKYGLSMRCVVR